MYQRVLHLRFFVIVFFPLLLYFCSSGSNSGDDLRERRKQRIQERSARDRPTSVEWHEELGRPGAIPGGMDSPPDASVTPSAEETSARLINSGKMALESGDPQSAINLFSQAIDQGVNASIAYYNRAVVYRNQEQYERALADYNKAIELNKEYVDAYTGRGVTRYLQEDYQKAIEDYNTAISLDSGYAGAYYNRGIARYRLDGPEAACDDWRNASRMGFPQATEVVQQFCR